jgi:hypothetical protein
MLKSNEIVKDELLGKKAKDKITGFTGIIVAKTEYLTGCTRYSLQSTELANGKPQDWVGFDEDQLELIEEPKVNLNVKRAGGPQPWEPRNSDRG